MKSKTVSDKGIVLTAARQEKLAAGWVVRIGLDVRLAERDEGGHPYPPSDLDVHPGDALLFLPDNFQELPELDPDPKPDIPNFGILHVKDAILVYPKEG